MAKARKPAASKKTGSAIISKDEFQKCAASARRKGVLVLGPFGEPRARGKTWYHVFNKANPDLSLDINQRYTADDLSERIRSLPARSPKAAR